eukprot:Blabericola_migrator_1__4650@NODE_2461_length_2724_cov_504_228453_g1540_i0_p5_GENE_NODE_2461_length_2724_cov_504_228453_g1540_i0NODE_2461_length_2724_cov_504_228453_g1540_i0_p5_ORF_typecomplete_len100_score13_74RecA_dep_nuc/PF16786_5/8_6RecA_dep_nuc/PF16786_5/17_NODE_2461_length_2724_cov_504_228453_g1540_i021152414
MERSSFHVMALHPRHHRDLLMERSSFHVMALGQRHHRDLLMIVTLTLRLKTTPSTLMTTLPQEKEASFTLKLTARMMRWTHLIVGCHLKEIVSQARWLL